MKVLFVSSGNSKMGISPIIKRQGESLIVKGLDVQFFTIKGKGIKGYLGNVKKLRNIIQKFQPDIVHAHYSASAYVATIASSKTIVVSLMGSDVNSSFITGLLIKFFNWFFWKHAIVKSEEMYNYLGMSNISVIPNGVDTRIFTPMHKADCLRMLGWSEAKKHILFAANPERPEKNYKLAKQAFELLNDKKIELHVLHNVSSAQIPLWMNASEVVFLTSKREGSPNVIKEAMACGRPVVVTDVGDIRWVFGETNGCYICSFDPNDVAEKLKMAIDFSDLTIQTSGVTRIKELGLDSGSVAEKIIEIYRKIEKNRI